MRDEQKLQKIIGRIQQLRAQAKSTHSKHEREACIQIASKLIAEYQLQECELEVRDGTKDEFYTNMEGDFNILFEAGRASAWKAQLASGVADINGLYALQCQVRNSSTHRRGSRFRVFGRKGDIELAKYMFGFLLETIIELSEMYIPGRHMRGVNPERESWCLGCVHGFLAKMRAEKQYVLQAATSTAMVHLANRTAESEAAFFDANPKIKIGSSTGSKAQHNVDAFSSGYKKGQTLSINKGLKGSS